MKQLVQTSTILLGTLVLIFACTLLFRRERSSKDTPPASPIAPGQSEGSQLLRSTSSAPRMMQSRHVRNGQPPSGDEERQTESEIAYKSSPLGQRRELTWSLALSRSEKAVEVLTNSLVTEFRGHTLGETETQVIYDTVQVLGFLAQSQDSAYHFLKQGLEFEFWKTNRPWIGAGDRHNGTEQVLVNASIAGLGASGRVEVATLLQELATRRDAAYVYRTGGAIASAAFYFDYVNSRGLEELVALFRAGEPLFEEYKEWTKTAPGRRWQQWSDYIAGHKPETVK